MIAKELGVLTSGQNCRIRLFSAACLGYLLDREHVRTTLQSIYRNNYKPNLREYGSVQRTYALNDDAGVVVATYPNGKRPEIPFPYFAEVWNGLEYQLATHMIYEGMIDEALTVVESVRRRHDGERRNPWNEPECGHHYARPMASWAVLIALSGFHYSAVERNLTLTPRVSGSSVRSFWTVPSGWGTFELSQTAAALDVQVAVAEGSLRLTKVVLKGIPQKLFKTVSATIGGGTARTKLQNGAQPIILFEQELRVALDSSLAVSLGI